MSEIEIIDGDAYHVFDDDNKVSTPDSRACYMYNSIPEEIREDICEATIWAKDYMMRQEGEGHQFYVFGNSDGTTSCSFAKPSWGGDHHSRPMEHGAQSIVMAVCEYVNGM
jgi:hypothetical protein